MLIRTCTLAIVFATCLASFVPRANAADESSDQPGRASRLSGQPTWFPLGGGKSYPLDQFEAKGRLLAFTPYPCWFIDLVRERGSLEEKAAKEQTASAKPKQNVQIPANQENATQGPPLLPPKRLEDLPVVDQGASLSLNVAPADSPNRLRFSLTLKAAERTVWREAEQDGSTNTVPLLFAFYADGKAIAHRATISGLPSGHWSHELVTKGGKKTWSLLVDAKSMETILENRQPSELAIVAVFSERQHQPYREGEELLESATIDEPQVPQTAIVVRSNVVRLKQSAGRWESAKEPK